MSVGFQDFPTPPNSFGNTVADIVPGPGGAVWFTETPEPYTTDLNGPNPKALIRITPDGVSSNYSLGTGVGVVGIASGPDGSVWFTTYTTVRDPITHGRDSIFLGIDRIGPDGRLTKLVTDKAIEPTNSMKVGPDGNLWIAEWNPWVVGHPDDPTGRTFDRITPAGVVTKFNAPNARSYDFAVGPDNSVWYTAELNPARGGLGPSRVIERLTPGGRVIDYPLPAADQAGGIPEKFTAGPDGNIWFVDAGINRGDRAEIGRITPTGSIAEYPIAANTAIGQITAGSDGDLWFSEIVVKPARYGPHPTGVTKVGRITTGGSITEFVAPSGSSQPGPIAVGADGNVWFAYTEFNLHWFDLAAPDSYTRESIGRLVIPRPQVVRVDRVDPPNLSIQLGVTFSTGLDSAGAEDLANYTLTAVGPGGRPGSGVRLDSAIYDPASRTVTIRVHGPLDPRVAYRLTIDGRSGHGLRSPEGFRLAGAGAGRAGTDYSTIIPRAGRLSLARR